MPNRRTKYWIDLAVQGSIVRRIIVHWFVFFSLCMVLLPIWRVISGAEMIGPFSALLGKAWIETAPAFILMLLLLPLFVWDTVKLSNRFAGPMYRVRTALRQAAAGEPVPAVKLRKADFWKDVAADLNTVLERLNAYEAAREQASGSGDTAPRPSPGSDKSKKEAPQLV